MEALKDWRRLHWPRRKHELLCFFPTQTLRDFTARSWSQSKPGIGEAQTPGQFG